MDCQMSVKLFDGLVTPYLWHFKKTSLIEIKLKIVALLTECKVWKPQWIQLSWGRRQFSNAVERSLFSVSVAYLLVILIKAVSAAYCPRLCLYMFWFVAQFPVSEVWFPLEMCGCGVNKYKTFSVVVVYDLLELYCRTTSLPVACNLPSFILLQCFCVRVFYIM